MPSRTATHSSRGPSVVEVDDPAADPPHGGHGELGVRGAQAAHLQAERVHARAGERLVDAHGLAQRVEQAEQLERVAEQAARGGLVDHRADGGLLVGEPVAVLGRVGGALADVGQCRRAVQVRALDVDAAHSVHHVLEPGVIDDREVVDAVVGELLDGPHEQRGTTEAVRRADLGWSAVGDVDQGVAGDGHHRRPRGAGVQVDVDAGQREHGVAALAGVGAHDQEADAVGDRRGAVGVVEAGEDVRHARDVAGELLDGEEHGPAGQRDEDDRSQQEDEQRARQPALLRRLGRFLHRGERRRRAIGRAVEERVVLTFVRSRPRCRAILPSIHGRFPVPHGPHP